MLIQALLSSYSPLLLFATISWLPTLATASPPSPSPSSLPHRLLAGIPVIDTPIVRAAQAYAQRHCSPGTYNHVMRTWLFGVLHLSHNAILAAQVDREVHAVGLMLHDLANNQSLDAPFLTLDRRFEVDSAFAATDFIRNHPDGRKWSDVRVQRVWDGIALHAEPKFALYKEADVYAIYWGNELDFSWGRPGGERMGVTEEEHARVLAEFPRPVREGPNRGVIDFIAWWCKYKPESTYNTWMQSFGEVLVPGYSAVGHRVLDGSLAEAGLNMSEILP